MVNRVSFYGQGQRAPLDANPDYPRRQMVEQLMARAGNDAPIQSHYQGLNQVLQGALGGWMDNRGRQKVADEKALESSEMAKMLSGLRPQEIDYSLPAKYNVGYSGDSAAVGGGDYEGASSADYDGGGFDAPPKMTPGGYAGALAAPATTPGAKQMQATLMMNQFQDEQALQLAATKRAQDMADAQTIYRRNRTDTLTDAQSKFKRDTELAQLTASLKNQGEGPFSGTGMDAQSINILLQGDPSSAAYIAAYNYYAQPKVSINPNTGQITTISPDMSAFRPPMGGTGQPGTGQGTPSPTAAKAPVGSVGDMGADQPMAGQPLATTPVAPPDATTMNVPGAIVSTTPGRKPTEFNQGQSNAATFSDRMTAAEDVLSKYEMQGTDFWANLKSNVPGGNYMLSPQYQMFDQAKRDFTNAQLREESGAVIGPSEFASANEQYFPQPGDSPQVIKQKRENRKIAINGMRRAAGPAYTPPTISDGPAANLVGTPQGGPIKRIQSDADYNALPSGAEFVGPDGVKRIKP
jgi:hypothetical protein